MPKVTQLRVNQGFKSRCLKRQEISAIHYLPSPGIGPKLQRGILHLNIRTKQLIVKTSGNEMNSRCDRSPKKNMKISSII